MSIKSGWGPASALACLAAAVALLAPATAHSLEPVDPVQVCKILGNPNQVQTCMMAIDRVPVDPLAASACVRLKNKFPVTMCMRAIAGRQYARADITACDEMTDVWETVICFARRGRRVADRNFSGNLADQICLRLPEGRQVELCSAAFQEGYVQPSAALACDRFNDANDTISCLDAILNVQYSEAEVAACDSLRTSTETIACFKREPGAAAPVGRPRPFYNRPPPAVGSGGCNSYGCYPPGGGCNSYGCYAAGGGCNSYGCYQPGGGCNSYGCWKADGGCNSYGCWRNGGGCNSYGCWHTRQGSCNSYGCSPVGECNSYGCPRLR